ncbi:MAG: hypothetical protein GY732_03085, partial [Gammaproteobacteria bacterium]|nr:hypothetical protein [Gammaproteobacteria bacterium]
GTFIIEGKTFKLRPAGVEDYHILYEVKNKNDKYLLQLNNELKNEKKARWLEAKGMQRDLLTEIPEASFALSKRGSIRKISGDLSKSEIGKLEIKNQSDLKRALKMFAPYYAFIGSEEFTIYNHSSTAEVDVYYAIESINGIKISGSHLKVFVNKTDQRITRVVGAVAVDRGFTTIPLISEDDAKTLALDYMATKYEGRYSRFEASEAKLIYSFAELWEPDVLRLNWVIAINRDGSPVHVLVDADSGEIIDGVSTLL